MDPDDLHRAFSVEPPVGTPRPDAVGIVLEGVRNAKRRRTYAGIVTSIVTVIVIVVAITTSIGAVNRSSAPPEPADLHTTSATTGATASDMPATSPHVAAVLNPTTLAAPITITASASTARSTPRPVAPAPPSPARSHATSTTPAGPTSGQPSQVTTEVGTTDLNSTLEAGGPPALVSSTPLPQTTPDFDHFDHLSPRLSGLLQLDPPPPQPQSHRPHTFDDFVGSYNHHTSGIEIKNDRTGLIADVVGCCNGMSYPLKFSGPDNGVLVATVTGPGEIIGSGEGQRLTVGDTIELRFVPGATGPILQTTGFPPRAVQVWCGSHGDPRCGA